MPSSLMVKVERVSEGPDPTLVELAKDTSRWETMRNLLSGYRRLAYYKTILGSSHRKRNLGQGGRQSRDLVLESQSGNLKDLGSRQASIGVGNLVRVDVLRQLADDKVEQVVRGGRLPENSVTGTRSRIGTQRLQLGERGQVLGIPLQNPGAIAAKIVHDEVLALGVDKHLMHVRSVLACGHGTSGLEGRIDDLKGLVEGTIFSQADDRDRAPVAAPVSSAPDWDPLYVL